MQFYDVLSFIPERSVGFFIRRIERLMTSRAEPLFADCAVSFTQWVSLVLVDQGLAHTCSALSRSLGHNSGATTRMVDQLEERGFITRQRETEDRRVVTLTLTPEGKDVLSELTPRMLEFWNEVLGDFEHQEIETLIALLARLMRALEARPVPETQA